MAKLLGDFDKTEDAFNGEIQALDTGKLRVAIVPEEPQGENWPTWRGYVGSIQVAAGWDRTSRRGNRYIRLHFEDPRFGSFWANLCDVKGQHRLFHA